MTHIENIKALGNRIVDNLNTMGVSASFSDGALTLADKILEIQTGLNLNTNLTLTSSSQSINFGESIVLTSKLIANYDGSIDLHNGLLENATIKFYNGDTLIGTSTTDINGEASLTYTPSNYGDIILKAVFEGDEGFNPTRSSNVMVTVIAFDGIILTSDKSIVSSGDTVNLTAQLTLNGADASVSGETVQFINNETDEVIGTGTTNASGIATVSYLVQGSEPLSIKAKCGIILSEIFRVYMNKDLTSYLISTSDYVAKDSPVNGISAGSVSKLSVSNNIATLSATAHVWNTQEFTTKQDYILMFDVVNAGYPGYDWGFYIGDSKDACVGVNFQYSKAGFRPSGNISFNTRYTSYVPVIITRHNENWNININNGQINQDFTYTGEILNKLSMVKFSGGNMSIKNLKIII